MQKFSSGWGKKGGREGKNRRDENKTTKTLRKKREARAEKRSVPSWENRWNFYDTIIQKASKHFFEKELGP